MTCIVNVKSKKELKAAVKEGADPLIEDPSIVAPFTGHLSEYLERKGRCVLTNHPRRSFFAEAKLRDGKIAIS